MGHNFWTGESWWPRVHTWLPDFTSLRTLLHRKIPSRPTIHRMVALEGHNQQIYDMVNFSIFSNNTIRVKYLPQQIDILLQDSVYLSLLYSYNMHIPWSLVMDCIIPHSEVISWPMKHTSSSRNTYYLHTRISTWTGWYHKSKSQAEQPLGKFVGNLTPATRVYLNHITPMQ